MLFECFSYCIDYTACHMKWVYIVLSEIQSNFALKINVLHYLLLSLFVFQKT